MKIIFLDIDGVLNDFERSWREVPDYNPELVPRCVQAFNRIIRETEARVVLSSSWRHLIIQNHLSIHGFQVLLRTHGVRGHLVNHTRAAGDEERWQEIADWLRKPMFHGGARIEVDHYAIIDDDPGAFGGRPGVQTAGGVGLTEKDADEVIAILS